MGPSEDTRVEILSRPECLDLLGQASLGRIGVSIDALPVILPVHFSLRGETVLFPIDPGTKLEAATIGNVIAFQTDDYEPLGDTGWSVLLQGIASAVTAEQVQIHSAPIGLWPGGETDRRLVQVQAIRLGGRRFRGLGGAGGARPL